MDDTITVKNGKSGYPLIGVGGGSKGDTSECYYVVNDRYQLKDALFVRDRGDITNSINQAYVPIAKNDIVVFLSAHKDKLIFSKFYKVGDVDKGEPNITHKIDVSLLSCEESKIVLENTPKSVFLGMKTIGNRNGMFFCSTKKEKKKIK